MPRSDHELLVVAASARALVQSAARAEWRVTAIDGFADTDTRDGAHAWIQLAYSAHGFDRATLIRAVRRYAGHTLVYGGGLEWTPDVLDQLARDHEIAGNSTTVMHDITNPRRLFHLLDRLGIPYPPVRYTPPEDGRWLIKNAAGAGGGHVRFWNGARLAHPSSYFQQYLDGHVFSVLFLANGSSHRIVGWNQIWSDPIHTERRFAYRGAVNHADELTATVKSNVTGWVDRLVTELSLKGLNGIDFVITQDAPWLLDVNCRPTSTFMLYDHEYPRGLIDAHIQACRGILPNHQPQHPPRAHKIVVAPQTLSIPFDLNWPHWCADRPRRGSTIICGTPLCTVSAEGVACNDVLRGLEHREYQILHDLLFTPRGPVEVGAR